LVIVDECHHVPAISFETVLKQVNARYVYGLSATPKREDGHHAITFLECGPIRYRVDARAQAKKRPFDHYVVPRFTNFLPTSAHDDSDYNSLLNDLAADESRNRMIIGDIVSAISAGRNPLVITERVEHASILAEALSEECKNVIRLTGQLSAAAKREKARFLRELDPDEQFVIVATGRFIGEGFDYPRLDTLFLTLPIKAKTTITQYTGRLHRLLQGKADVMVYDFVDINIMRLEVMYHQRVRAYKSQGYKTISAGMENEWDQFNIIFNPDEYFDPLLADMKSAKKEMVISTPFISSHKITNAMPALSAGILNNIAITIVTRPPEGYAVKYRDSVSGNIKRLQESGVNVVIEPGLHQRFIVIDQQTVWYGSINPLGFSNVEENIIRLDGADIAKSILNQNYSRAHGQLAPDGSKSKQISLFDYTKS